MECSKKILLASTIIFIFVVVSIFVLPLLNIYVDTTVSVTLISVSGGFLTTAVGFYYWKARTENMIKIKISYLEKKYEMLNNMNLIDANQEILNETQQIDDAILSEEQNINID